MYQATSILVILPQSAISVTPGQSAVQKYEMENSENKQFYVLNCILF